MAQPRDLGLVPLIVAESIGQPGQRRFRLCAVNASGESAAVWLEKEQLNSLGEAIEAVLKNEGYVHRAATLDDMPTPPALPGMFDLDLPAARLSIGVNSDARELVLIAAEGPDDDSGGPPLMLRFEFRQGAELRQQVLEVVAAGRPPCPLCGGPVDPAGHVCVRTNGHHPD